MPDLCACGERQNFGPGWGGRRCHGDTLHRSNPVVRGTKVVLQRWHSYLEHPFLAARPLPGPDEPPALRASKLPFQPVVSCDYVEGGDVNVSCRWYNAGACQMGYCAERG